MSTALKSLLVWLALLVLAIANGVLREAVLVPQLGSVTGLVASGLLLSAIVFAITFATILWPLVLLAILVAPPLAHALRAA